MEVLLLTLLDMRGSVVTTHTIGYITDTKSCWSCLSSGVITLAAPGEECEGNAFGSDPVCLDA